MQPVQWKANSPLTRLLAKRRAAARTLPLQNNSVRNTTSTDYEYPNPNINQQHQQYNSRNNNSNSNNNVNTDANITTTNKTYTKMLGTKQLMHHIHALELERDQSHIQVELETKRANESTKKMNQLSSSVTALQDIIAHMRVTALHMDAEKTEATLLKHDRFVKLVRQESDATLLQLQQKISKNQNQHKQDINNKTDHIRTLKNKITGLKKDYQEELKHLKSNIDIKTNKLNQCAATIKKQQQYVLVLRKYEKMKLEEEAAGILASVDQQTRMQLEQKEKALLEKEAAGILLASVNTSIDFNLDDTMDQIIQVKDRIVVFDQKMEMTNTVETLMASLASSEERNEALHKKIQLFQQELIESEQMIQKQNTYDNQHYQQEGEEGACNGTNGMDEDLVSRLRSFVYTMTSSTHAMVQETKEKNNILLNQIKDQKDVQTETIARLQEQRIIQMKEMKEMKEKATKHVEITLLAKEQQHQSKMQVLERLNAASKKTIQNLELEKKKILEESVVKVNVLNEKVKQEQMWKEERKREVHELTVQLKLASERETASSKTKQRKGKNIPGLPRNRRKSIKKIFGQTTAALLKPRSNSDTELVELHHKIAVLEQHAVEYRRKIFIASERETELHSMMELKEKEMNQLHHHQVNQSNEQVTHQMEWESIHVISSILNTVIEQTIYDSNQDERNTLQKVTLEIETLREKVKSYTVTSKEAEQKLRLLDEEMKQTNKKIEELTKQHLVVMKEKNEMLIKVQQQNDAVGQLKMWKEKYATIEKANNIYSVCNDGHQEERNLWQTKLLEKENQMEEKKIVFSQQELSKFIRQFRDIDIRETLINRLAENNARIKYSKEFSQEELSKFIRQFRDMDIDDSGTIDTDEIDQAFALADIDIDRETLIEIIEEADEDDSGEVDIDEWIGIQIAVRDGPSEAMQLLAEAARKNADAKEADRIVLQLKHFEKMRDGLKTLMKDKKDVLNNDFIASPAPPSPPSPPSPPMPSLPTELSKDQLFFNEKRKEKQEEERNIVKHKEEEYNALSFEEKQQLLEEEKKEKEHQAKKTKSLKLLGKGFGAKASKRGKKGRGKKKKKGRTSKDNKKSNEKGKSFSSKDESISPPPPPPPQEDKKTKPTSNLSYQPNDLIEKESEYFTDKEIVL